MKVVIFDMDGTLIDSQVDITISINHIRQKHHLLEPLSSDYVVEAINRDQRNLARLFYGTESYLERDKLLFEEHYFDQCIQNTTLYKGIKELLEELKTADVKLSVATNAPTKFAKRMLMHLDVVRSFDHIIGADKVVHPKPHEEMLHHILQRYGFVHKMDSAWMVGDNTKDMQAAENAGISAVFATWGFSPDGIGDCIIKEPLELLDIL